MELGRFPWLLFLSACCCIILARSQDADHDKEWHLAPTRHLKEFKFLTQGPKLRGVGHYWGSVVPKNFKYSDGVGGSNRRGEGMGRRLKGGGGGGGGRGGGGRGRGAAAGGSTGFGRPHNNKRIKNGASYSSRLPGNHWGLLIALQLSCLLGLLLGSW